MEKLTDIIKESAHTLGFEKVGIASAVSLDTPAERLDEWLHQGRHATMAWMSTRSEERKNITKYFPEAKSVISVGMNYFHGIADGEMKISNYAWGDDYHDLLKKRLYQLLKLVKERLPDVKGVVCCYSVRPATGSVGYSPGVVHRRVADGCLGPRPGVGSRSWATGYWRLVVQFWGGISLAAGLFWLVVAGGPRAGPVGEPSAGPFYRDITEMIAVAPLRRYLGGQAPCKHRTLDEDRTSS